MTDVLILSDAGRIPHGPVWGAPGEFDEALAWLTLVRLLGWRATVVDRDRQGLLGDAAVAIVTGRPDDLTDARRGELAAPVGSRPLLVVTAPAAPGGDWVRLSGVAQRPGAALREGGEGVLSWEGPGRQGRWRPVAGLHPQPLELASGVEVWAALDGEPVIVARRLPSRGVIATLAFDSSRARAEGAATALLKRLLTCGCPLPTAWLDLEGSVVLRMDDPGSSCNVHLRSWSYAKLGERDWQAVGAALRVRGARLSVAYTPGWVDDGDTERGTLEVAGRPVARAAGAVHPSALVVHSDRRGHAPGRVNDYTAEFRGLMRLQAEGLIGVEQHGYTHMPADLSAWVTAPDRYENVAWYREFTAEAERGRTDGQIPVARGAEAIQRHFCSPPTTLVCPGQAWTEATLEQALAAGLRLVSADGLALRDGERFCWCAGFPAAYLDKPDRAQLESELPVIAFFHDYELATGGVDWMATHLDAWRRAGARRLIDFRELAAALELRLELTHGAQRFRVTATGGHGPPPPRPFPVLVHVPSGEPPLQLELDAGAVQRPARVQRLGDGLGRLILPAG